MSVLAQLGRQETRWAVHGDVVNLHQQKSVNEIHAKPRPRHISAAPVLTLKGLRRLSKNKGMRNKALRGVRCGGIGGAPGPDLPWAGEGLGQGLWKGSVAVGFCVPLCRWLHSGSFGKGAVEFAGIILW